MARTKSVVLSKEEKKNLIADLKAQIKAAKEADKAANAELKAATKAHNEAVKTANKAAATRAKELSKLQSQLDALTAKEA